MKYKYSRLYYTFQIVFGIIAGVCVLFLMLKHFMPDDPKFHLKVIISEVLGLGVIIFLGSKSWLNKFIELKENHIHFHNYQDGGVIGNYDVKYKDIDSVNVKTFPLIGTIRIDLRLKNGDLFEIANTYSRHKELFYNLTVKLQNETSIRHQSNQSGDGSLIDKD